MAEERIDIVIREQGAKVVQRSINDIGKESSKAASGADLLKRALAGIGTAAIARELQQLVDHYTTLQNKLRATGLAGDELAGSYRRLLSIANANRQSVESTVTTYSRLAQSAKDLGITQEQVFGFTNQLSQAVALSGATAAEAEAAMIQLSQGMASGTLRGDELRSVMEQLPAVADVIAKQLKVTRGELRQMGQDGKITTDIIISAFDSAKTELAEKFGKTVPTIGQSFVVLKNQFVTLLGEFDKATGVSSGFSSLILGLANGMEPLINNIGGVADAVTSLTKVLLVAGVAWGTYQAAQAGGRLVEAAQNFLAYRAAIAEGTVVVLGSAEAERQKAVALAESATAQATSAAGALRAAQAEEAQAAARLAGTRAVGAQLVAERELEVTRLAAQISDQGRAASLTRLAEIRVAEASVTKAQAVAQAELNATQVATATAQRGMATASAEAARAQAALGTATKNAAGSTSLLGQAVNAAKAGVRSLFTMIAANPFTIIITAIAAAVAALYVFRNQIKLGIDQTTSLGDLMVAVKNRIMAAWKVFSDWFGSMFKKLGDFVSQFGFDFNISLGGAIRGIAQFIDLLGGAIRAEVARWFSLFKSLPDVLKGAFTGGGMDAIAKAWNDAGQASATAFKQGVGATAAFDSLLTDAQAIGKKRVADEAAAPKEGESTATFGTGGGGGGATDGAAEAAKKLKDELNSLIESYDGVFAAQNKYNAAMELLNQGVANGLIPAERRAEIQALMEEQLRDSLDPLAAINREMDKERELMGLSSAEREVEIQMRSILKDLAGQGVIATKAETEALRAKIIEMQRETAQYEMRAQILQDIRGPQEEFMSKLGEVQAMMEEGTLKQGEHNLWLMQSNSELFAGTSVELDAMAAKYEQTYARINALQAGNVISAQTAFAARAKTFADSQATMLSGAQQFFGSLTALQGSENKKQASIGKAAAIAQATISTYLAATQAFAAMSGIPIVGPVLGGVAAAAAIAAGMAQVSAIKSQPLPGYAFGGDMVVGGVGGTDSQTVAFRATPGERVSITTPAQDSQRARNQSGGGGNSFNFVLPNVTNETEARASAAQIQRSLSAAAQSGRRYA